MVLTLLDTTRKVNGVEQDTGALGHGLAFAVGLALAGKRGRKDYRVFTLLGHGELAEGSHWEARMTHHSLHDFAALRAINNVTIVASADNFETGEAVIAAAKTDAPVYLRFRKKKMPHLPRGAEGFELGKASVVRQGTDLTFLACGETPAPAWQAAESLTKEGIACRAVSVHTIKPLDEAAVLAAAQTGGIITAEEHSVSGSLGEACAALLLQAGTCVPFKIVDFPDDYTITGGQVEISMAELLR